jgi:hypothetical protein
MKVFDILKEEKSLNEAPMGALGSIGNKIASKFGSQKAVGRLETGNLANQLKKEFDAYLGKTGLEADQETILNFLKQKGYPTKKASAIGTPASSTAPQGPGEAPAQDNATAPQASTSTPAKTAKPRAPKPTEAEKATQAIAANRKAKQDIAGKSARDSMTPAPTQSPAAQPDYDTPAWQRKGKAAPELTAAPQQPKTTTPNFRSQPAGNVSYGSNVVKGAPMKPMQVPGTKPNLTSSPAPAAAKPTAPAQSQPAAPAPAKKQLSQSPRNVARRQTRAAAKQQPVTAGIYEAALPKSIIDKMLLAAAQEAQQIGMPAQASQSGADSTGTSQGGFASGFKQGLSGQPSGDAEQTSEMTADEIIEAAKKLTPRDQKKIIDLLTRYMQGR